MTFIAKITWVDSQGNAICAGMDETVNIEAGSADEAKRDVAENALHFAAEQGRSEEWLNSHLPQVEILQ